MFFSLFPCYFTVLLALSTIHFLPFAYSLLCYYFFFCFLFVFDQPFVFLECCLLIAAVLSCCSDNFLAASDLSSPLLFACCVECSLVFTLSCCFYNFYVVYNCLSFFFFYNFLVASDCYLMLYFYLLYRLQLFSRLFISLSCCFRLFA